VSLVADFSPQFTSDVCQYNVQNYIQKLEETKEWHFPFERFKHIDSYKEEEAKSEPKIEEIKDEDVKTEAKESEGAEDVVKKLQ
jgi:hypothetical protein